MGAGSFTSNIAGQRQPRWKAKVLDSGFVQALHRINICLRKDIVIASLAINVLSMALPIVILQLYDRIIPNQSTQTLGVLVAALVVVVMLETVLRLCRILMMNRLGAEFEHNATLKIVDVVVNAKHSHFEANRHSTYLEKFKALENIREAQFGQSILSLLDLPFIILFLVMIWFFTGWLVLVPLSLFLVFSIFSLFFSRALYAALTERDDLFERRHNFLLEVLQGIQTLKPLAMESQMLRRHERMQGQSAQVIYRLAHINNLIQASTSTLSQFVMVLFVIVGSVPATSGAISIGALAAGSMLAGRLLQPASRALNFWMQWQSAKIAEEKLLDLLALPQEEVHAQSKDHSLTGEIRLQNASYIQATTKRVIVDDINVHIKANDFIAIVGDNGAGKTTLAKLLIGLLRTTRGTIHFDDTEIRQLSPICLRKQIALVPQRGALLNGTILENLTAFRRGDATKQAMKYAQALGLDEDIRRMVDGLTTQVDNSLVDNMPEGLRQRIVMIRAMIGDSKVVIFDDANTGFDPENSAKLHDFLRSIKGTKTIIAMTHQDAIINLSDHCYKLSQGRLSEIFSRIDKRTQQPKSVRVTQGIAPVIVGGKRNV